MAAQIVYMIVADLSTTDLDYRQIDNQNGTRNPSDRIFADIESVVFYLNLIGMYYANHNATVTIDGTGKNTAIYVKYIDGNNNHRINIRFSIREIAVVSQANIFKSDIDDDPNLIVRFFTPTEEIKAYHD